MARRSLFSILEEHSYCWVTWSRGAYWLYGNELGRMAGPCTSAADAVARSGFQFGSSVVRFETRLPEAEFRQILELRKVILFDNIDYAEINDVVCVSPSVEHLIETYRLSKAKEKFRTFHPRKSLKQLVERP
jgi:hypothetical protein